MRDQANKNLKQRKNGFWHFQRLKPADIRDRLPGGKFVQRALGTDSLIEARRKRDVINAQLDLKWASLRGEPAEYLRHVQTLPDKDAVDRLPSDPDIRRMVIDKIRNEIHEFLANDDLEGLMKHMQSAPYSAVNAWMIQAVQKAALAKVGFAEEEIGQGVQKVSGETKGSKIMLVSDALQAFCTDIAVETTSRHSPSQKRNYENQKKRSVQRFIAVVGDLPLFEITRADATKFHKWWQTRIVYGDEDGKKYSGGAGIKELSDMRQIWGEVAERFDHQERNPFRNLTFKENKRRKQAYSRVWIKDHWLSGEGLAGMNDEQRRIILMLVETGARPSEILRLPLERFQLDHAIPHIMIDNIDDNNANERGTVKTDSSIRSIPLVGVALSAAKALAASGGVQRYWDKSNSFSAATNKYLRENGLQEDRRTVGGLRHAFVEALKEISDCDADLRRELAGHKPIGSHNENYGRFTLQRKQNTLLKIVLPFDQNII